MSKVIKIICVIFIFIYQNAYPQVDNKILVKVDNKIITIMILSEKQEPYY